MKRASYLFAAMFFSTSIAFAQSPLFTDFGVVNATATSPNPNVGIGINNPTFLLHTFAPVGMPGVELDVDNFSMGNGNAVPAGGPYNGALGQNNSIINGSSTSFTLGTMNIIDQSMSSFSGGFSNTIITSIGQGGCIALGGRNHLENTEESAAIGEDNQILNGHGSISLGGHNRNDGPYTITIGSGLTNNLGTSLMAGFNDTTFFIGNNRIGIGNITNPQELLHVGGRIRSDALAGGGNVCADVNGNLILSGPCSSSSSGITSTCTSAVNYVPKSIDAAGNLGCSQIYDDGTSVGIGSIGPFGYTWSGGLTGPTLPPSSGTLKLDVNGVTQSLAYIATSDANMKTNIEEITNAREILAQLAGKTYNWNRETLEKTGATDIRQYGFIAQEVAEVLPEAVSVNAEGQYGVNYTYFIPLLTEGYKAQQAELQEKDREIDALREQMNAMMNELTAMRNAINAMPGSNLNTGGIDNSDAGVGSSLVQNEPNPFSQRTTVRFELTDDVQNASVFIYDLNGEQEAHYQIQKGQTEVVIERKSLQPGIYIYSLVTDGRIADTKRMVISD
jgi:hypothetical protein